MHRSERGCGGNPYIETAGAEATNLRYHECSGRNRPDSEKA